MATHGLRTTGTHTGNFGYAKVKGKPGELDLTKKILNKEDLRIPERDEAFTRLVEAYNTTTDPRLKAGLWEILKRRKATLQPIEVKPTVCDRTHWDLVKLTR
jgi:hypothetical protein